ncbi:lysine transporter LysE [Mucilaginibacter sp. PPCGB 2223]|uniref:LysE family transporter n=1 Tax=Mucilaginibacter sp. PPCGB 2223 TaxID=1886027 RepID=UPI0008257A24|nr:LysE family transporter [Mucilaginibacter sp. PPCGB 2223]OCX54690.1 lysine transporter LysE [Mucilaginibacter sp. PPCGB 2223]
MIFLTIFLGLAVNFIGYVPPGNINLTLVQITINRGLKQALQFITAFSCVELVFTYIIIHAAEWLSHQLKLEVIIDWVMVVLFGALGAITWVHRGKPPKAKVSRYHSVKHGIVMGIINPMQIPFWMISGTYLITHGWIVTGTWPLLLFSAGSALGAFLCLFIYARSARYIQTRFELSTNLINTCIAVLFFSFAAYHVVKQVYLLGARH